MAGETPSDGFEPFGAFLLLRPLGKGGMGIVYIARTSIPEFPLAAVKRLRPDAVNVPTFAERFAHEGELALRLSHANLVETLDVGEHRGTRYVASAFVAGKDLGLVADRLAEIGGGAPLAVAVRLLLDGLAGLGYVHNARERDGSRLDLVHRDITPGNLLLGYDGTARIADFGLAKSALTEHMLLTDEGMILGTPRYLPPEVVVGHKAGPAADLYGLGAVIYRVLTTLPPFEGNAREVVAKILNERPLPLLELRPDLPPWFSSFLAEMMEPDVGKRPHSAAPLARRLRALAETYGVLVTREEVSRWMIDLFRDVHAAEMEEIGELMRIDASRAIGLPSERTRVLRRPTERLVAREPDGGEPTEASPLEPTITMRGPTQVSATIAAPPRGPAMSWRVIVLTTAIAFLAGIGGVLTGVYLIERLGREDTISDERRWKLVERLGALSRRIEERRRAGAITSASIEGEIEKVRAAAREGRWEEAQVRLQDLELALER